jgi:tetratricopeptide (TPR) repeat protein
MFPSLRTTVVAASLSFLLSGSGCLHSWGTLKDQVVSSSRGETGRESPTVANKVESELVGKPAAQLAFTMGEQLEKSGKFADAIPYYEKARSTDAQLGTSCSRRLAVLYDRAGEAAKAQTEFQALLVSKPRDADLLNDYGYSLYNLGKWSEAESQFRKTLDINKTHKRAYVNLGLTLAQQGRAAESLECFERVVTPMEAKANLAFVLATQGKHDAAKSLYREALTGDPTLRTAQMGIAALEKNETPESPVKTVSGSSEEPAVVTKPVSPRPVVDLSETPVKPAPPAPVEVERIGE